MNAAKTNQKGFSIIEVVLVLAIAGLIFLMVFIALPALQRNQRDQARRSDVGIVGSALSSYASNNRGNLPANLGQVQQYVGDLSQYDKNSELQFTQGTGGAVTANVIRVNTRAKCDTSATATPGALTGGTTRQATVRVFLEGSNAIFCQDV